MEEKQTFSATDLGTFVHTALQLLPVDTLPLDIPGRLEDLERRGLIPEGAAAAVDARWLERFFTSPIAARIRRSPRVQRELPFNLAVPVRDVFPDEMGGDDILVQGIIDCCFIEDGRWVLVDYKTNRVDEAHTAASIAEHYLPQLRTYRDALEQITGIGVKEAWLYLLSVGKEIRVKL
jgi:ATP-dependent helicase/nuclease subunit A